MSNPSSPAPERTAEPDHGRRQGAGRRHRQRFLDRLGLCARALRRVGCEIAVTYLNDKAKRFVEPLAQQLEAPLFLPLDVAQPGQLEAVFDEIRKRWGKLDVAIHSIAFAPREDLQGRLTDCSAKGFGIAMDISCHSFVRMAKLAEPLMTDGGTLIAMSYHGAQKVVPNYQIMARSRPRSRRRCATSRTSLAPRESASTRSARPAQDASRLGAQGFRGAAVDGERASAGRRAGRHRRRRPDHRLSLHAPSPGASPARRSTSTAAST
jgi:NAD(P)-dependent dehydrogenase (short-subunit alcohol dehydrogenase family)